MLSVYQRCTVTEYWVLRMSTASQRNLCTSWILLSKGGEHFCDKDKLLDNQQIVVLNHADIILRD